jgi:hypothetical protein
MYHHNMILTISTDTPTKKSRTIPTIPTELRRIATTILTISTIPRNSDVSPISSDTPMPRFERTNFFFVLKYFKKRMERLLQILNKTQEQLGQALERVVHESRHAQEEGRRAQEESRRADQQTAIAEAALREIREEKHHLSFFFFF